MIGQINIRNVGFLYLISVQSLSYLILSIVRQSQTSKKEFSDIIQNEEKSSAYESLKKNILLT